MVLVDTSVWIRFLRNQAPYVEEVARLLDAGEVAGHDLIYGELLTGDSGGRTRLLADYARMRHVPTIHHGEVVEFVRARRLHGCGVGWIEVHLLASAIVAGVDLWTADHRLSLLAGNLGVAFSSPHLRA
jgi:hypothetical protein